ncbi:MAG: LamG-like jellyroll fold domain-containing protein [Verrucomicrobiales bacterium]
MKPRKPRRRVFGALGRKLWMLRAVIGSFTLLPALVTLSPLRAQTVIQVDDTPLQPVRYGMDYERLWFWYGSNSNKNQVATWSAAACDIDFIRVAINSGYELEEGVYDLKAYTNKIIPMMQSMRAANPDLEFFASPRPLNEAVSGASWQPYPLWITGASSYTSGDYDFDDLKCAQYLIRYLRLMKSYGFRIHYLDLTNEWQSNVSGGRITQSDARDVVEYLREYMENPPSPDPTDPTGEYASLPALEAEDMPKIVAPSSWEFSQGESWIRYLNSERKREAIDIAASHNTNRDSGSGTAKEFADQAKETLGDEVEIWNTELHGWKSTSGADEVTSCFHFFEAIQAGFTGISGWLAIGTPSQGHSYILNNGSSVNRNVKYYIFRKAVNSSANGRALGVSQAEEIRLVTAMLKDDLVSVWLINDSDEVVDVEVDLGSFSNPSGILLETRWSEHTSLEGETKRRSMTAGGNRFAVAVEADSVYCFEVPLADRFVEAKDLRLGVSDDGQVDLDLSADGNGGDLAIYTVLDTPEHGTLSGSLPNLTYTPDADFVGVDRFTYMFSDGPTLSTVGTVEVVRYEETLVAHWKLDETEGNVLEDATGNGYDGILVSGARLPEGGVVGGALDFDAGGDYAVLPAAAFDTVSSEVTLSMWVYGDTSQPRADTIFYATNEQNHRLLNIHLPYSDGTVFFDAGNATGYDRVSQAAASEDYRGRWNHWVFVKSDEGEMSMYLNGQEWLRGSNKNRLIDDITRVYLGSDGGSRNYDGMVDDVRFYNYAVDSAQIEALYKSYTENEAPVADEVSVRVVAGRSVSLPLAGHDPEGVDLYYRVIAPPSHGVLSGSGGRLVYTPDEGFAGVDSFTYVASDTFEDSAPATVAIHVKPALLLAHWPFDDGDGQVVTDQSGNGFHGTLTSGRWIEGMKGGGLEFDGVDDFVDFPAAAFAGLSEELSLSLWVWGGEGQPREDTLFYGTNSVNERILNVHLPWSDGRVYWDAAGRTSRASSLEEYAGGWNHWLFTKNASAGEMKIYLNGVEWHSVSGMVDSFAEITRFTLGAQSSVSQHYEGRVDEVTLFNYALSEDQALEWFQSFNESPIAMDGEISMVEGRTVAVPLVAVDPEGEVVSFRIVDGPSHGTLAGGGEAMSYTPDPGFTGVDRFRYVANDSVSDSEEAIITIDVRPARLLAHWSMDDGARDMVSDVSGGSWHGTKVSATWVDGVRGKALSFDGVDDRVELPAGAFANVGEEITLTMWVRGGPTQPAADVLFYGTNASNSRILNVHLPWDNSAVYWDASDRTSLLASSETYAGSWNYWTFTKNSTSGEMRIFLNGTPWHTVGGKWNPIAEITRFTLGAQSAGVRHYEGVIDEVRLYDYALADDEVADLYAGYSGSLAYLDWLAGYPQLGDTSFEADPDGDGMETGLEYIFGGDPTVPDASIAPRIDRAEGAWRFAYTRSEVAAEHTTQVVELSDDLERWSELSIGGSASESHVQITPLGDGMERVEVILDESLFSAEDLGDGDSLFLRLVGSLN